MLEPCAVKVARTVLRRGSGSNAASLSDRLALLEKNLEAKTQDISGQTSNDSLGKFSHQSASLKMFPTIYELDLKKSQMTYDNWVTKLRQACLQRRKLALHTKEKDYLSWPTITVTDASVMKARPPEKMIRKDGRNSLRNPSLAETILQPANFPKSKTDLQKQYQGLPYQTKKAWSTVTTQDYKKRGPNSIQQGLHEESRNWPTVRTSSANGASSKEIEAGNPKQRLEVMIANWPTPRAQEPGSTSENYGKGLKNTAENWATPTTRDWKDTANANVPVNSLLGRQAPQIMKDGTESQITLNPRFTEWLMGWPIGWTEFELAETEWFRWLQRMRGELSRMECISQRTIN